MDLLHVDFWSANSTALNVFLISPGPVETPYALPVSPETWVSVDIPLTAFVPVDVTNVFQFKFEGNGDVYLDNLYFSSTTTGVDNNLLTENFVLRQNYPNPFNPATTIRYEIPESENVLLIIYDIKGNAVRTIESGTLNAGRYEYVWTGLDHAQRPVSTGLYIAKIQAGTYSETIKMLYLK
jgi:hypothetical protein